MNTEVVKIIRFSLFTILFLTIGCEPPYDVKLTFKNTSNKEIFVKFVEKKNDIDYFMSNKDAASWPTFGHYLLPDSTTRFPAWYSWDEFIEKLEDKKVNFYVFDADSFMLFKTGVIDKNDIKYDYLYFNKEELKKMKWSVLYKGRNEENKIDN